MCLSALTLSSAQTWRLLAETRACTPELVGLWSFFRVLGTFHADVWIPAAKGRHLSRVPAAASGLRAGITLVPAQGRRLENKARATLTPEISHSIKATSLLHFQGTFEG